MSHGLTVTVLIATLVILVGALVLAVLIVLVGGSGGGVGCLGALVTLPLVVLVVILLFNSRGTSAEVTAYAALLAVIAGAFAWSMKATKESLQSRAELLISEALSSRSMDRDEIRAMVYANNVLFRLSKSAYVDALNHLLATRRVVLVSGRYVISEDASEQT